MIYVTGDTHGKFRRFTKKERNRLPFRLNKDDYVIVCGDLGLLWCKDEEFYYNLDWMERLLFTILWVQGNHENYNMIAEYELEMWNGGMVRHIIRDKIILLERGQIFDIEGKTFFTFGGASSHDIQGGILDKRSLSYREDYIKASRRGLPFRILNESWWKAELPTDEEMLVGMENLEKVGYKVDYVISHCMSTSVQNELEKGYSSKFYSPDILTDYFEEVEEKLEYRHWYSGHYHINCEVDDKHTIIYEKVLPLAQ